MIYQLEIYCQWEKNDVDDDDDDDDDDDNDDDKPIR